MNDLTPVDTAWLHMEDPTNLMMVTAVIEFDGHVDFERFRDTWATRLLRFERFRQRVVEPALPFKRPYWETDPTFDIDSHVHRIALPPPRSKRTLLGIIGDLSSTPLDFSKPLWQVHLIENYHGGSVAVMRFHHCIGDGTAMVGVTLRLMDVEPDAPLEVPDDSEDEAQDIGVVEGMIDAALDAYDTGLRVTGSLVRQTLDNILHPEKLLDLAAAARDGAGVIGDALLMKTEPETPFKGPLGVQKHVAWSEGIDLADAKAVCKRSGVKLNDLLLTAMAGALRHYLVKRRCKVSGLNLRAVVPVDLRPKGHALELGNVFGVAFLSLPVGLKDPVERLAEVQRRMNRIKSSPEPYVYFGLIKAFGLAPKQVQTAALELFGSKATAVMTNVMGPREPLFMAGSPVKNLMFWVPQSGRLGLGISIMSYAGKVTLGVMSDAKLVADPGAVTRRFAREFAQLCTALEDSDEL